MPDISNPPLAPWVRIFFVAVALILCVGVGLLFVPSLLAPRWLWQLTPFNTAFLGAIYLTELSVVLPFIANNRRSPGRMVLPCALTFVGVVSLLTLVSLDRFNMQRMATYAWFVVYFVPTTLLLYLGWNYRQLLATGRKKLPHPWPMLLMIEAVLLLLYGVALIFAPEMASSFWPWTIDAFHARMYSAFFLTLGVGAWVVARGCEKLDILTLGIAQTVTSVSVIGGFIVTDLALRRVNWLAGNTWLWIALFLTIGLIGVMLLGISRQRFADA